MSMTDIAAAVAHLQNVLAEHGIDGRKLSVDRDGLERLKMLAASENLLIPGHHTDETRICGLLFENEATARRG